MFRQAASLSRQTCRKPRRNTAVFNAITRISFPERTGSSHVCYLSTEVSRGDPTKYKEFITKEEDEDLDIPHEDGKFHRDEDKDMLVDESVEFSPSFRLGKNLLEYSRVHYKHVENFPPWFTKNQQEITNHRSSAQIRKFLQTWMLDSNHRTLNSKYADRPLIWRNDDADSNKSSSIQAYGPNEAIAYSYFYMPSRFTVTRRIFDEMSKYLPSFAPEKVIDFGCGPGTAGAAVLDVWGEKLKKYTGVDMSRAMLDSAKIMLENNNSYSYDCVFWDKIGDVVKRVHNTQERYNLAVLSYTLSELPTDVAKRAAVQVMFEMLEVGGCMVIIEAGSVYGSHIVRTARKFLLDHYSGDKLKGANSKLSKTAAKYSTADSDLERFTADELEPILTYPGLDSKEFVAKVVAPCTHDGSCPLGKNMICSYSQRVVTGMIRKGSEEKFSYVVIQKVHPRPLKAMGLDPWTNDDSRKLSPAVISGLYKDTSDLDPSPRAVLSDYLECVHPSEAKKLTEKLLNDIDWEEYSPVIRRNEWARVIKPPIKAKGHIIVDTCTPKATISRQVFTKTNVVDVPSLFVAIRKTTWGGIFPSDVITDPTAQAVSPLARKPVTRVEGTNHPFSRREEPQLEEEDGEDETEFQSPRPSKGGKDAKETRVIDRVRATLKHKRQEEQRAKELEEMEEEEEEEFKPKMGLSKTLKRLKDQRREKHPKN